jgi:hypothetical protein
MLLYTFFIASPIAIRGRRPKNKSNLHHPYIALAIKKPKTENTGKLFANFGLY